MISMLTRTRRLPRELFYGWIIVADTIVIELLVYGIRYSFSVFHLSILNEFGWSRASTAGIFSMNIIVYGLMTIIFVEFLIKKPRRYSGRSQNPLTIDLPQVSRFVTCRIADQ